LERKSENEGYGRSSNRARILVGTKRGKRGQRERKNAEQLSEWKRDQSSSMDGAELSYKARNMPWLSEIELTSNIRRNFGLSNWLRENVAVR
jgi:hypothetical protein